MILNKLILIKEKFKKSMDTYYFVSPTNFNLIDMNNWVNNWLDINYINCFDSSAQRCLIPANNKDEYFESLEQINHHLLKHTDTNLRIKEDKKHTKNSNIIFLFFNEDIEKTCKELGLKILSPKNSTVKDIDNKITTTEIGNDAKVYSVDNFLGKIENFSSLVTIAKENNLGSSWVIQTPFGDSGKTTFFITNEDEYNIYSKQIESEDIVKVMKRVNCVGSAIEACATKNGTFVGPLLGELVGLEELTPYKGGWCGNELYEDQFSKDIRAKIHERTERLGNALYKRGYKGYFEVDYLIDLDSNEIYLGEINPRITGISAITNTSPFCQGTIPLFLFHLIEYSNDDFTITPKEYNDLSLVEGAKGTSSQMIFKSTHTGLKVIESSPKSGVYKLSSENELEFIKESSNPVDKGTDPNCGYILRILKEGQYSYKGVDSVILFLNSKITKQQGTQLNSEAKKWISAVNKSLSRRELTDEEVEINKRFLSPSNIKGSN